MKKIIPFLSLLLCLGSIKARAQNPLWSLPPNSYKPGVANPPTPLPYMPPQYKSASNIQMDAYQNILFYVIDETIYDKDGDVIGDFTSYNHFNYPSIIIEFEHTHSSEIAIVPDPNNCNRYYIVLGALSEHGDFQYGENPFPNYEPFLAVVNFDLPRPGNINKMGAVEFITPITLVQNSPNYFNWLGPPAIFMAASELRNDNSRLVFLSNTNDSKIYRYRIDNTGFSYDGSIPFSTNAGFCQGEMELFSLTNGHYRLAVSGNNMIYIAELDANGNIYAGNTNTFNFSDAHIHGLEFSEDGSKLYITHKISPMHPSPFEYYDFITPNMSDPNGVYSLDIGSISGVNPSDFQFSQIELDGNGDLYLGAGGRLAKLSNSNNPIPSSPSFTDNAIVLPGYTATYHGQSIYDNPPDEEKSYTLPDQIDGMDYEARFTQNLQCCKDSRSYDVTTNTYGGNATWTASQNPINTTSGGIIYVQDELRFAAGSNITIKNMTFKFAPGAHVIIERGSGSVKGAVLTMDATTFTVDDRCDPNNLMWQGVQVWGYAKLPQLGQNVQQGRLNMNNTSVIEHAFSGVVAARQYNPGPAPYYYLNTTDYAYTGGIVYGYYSTFHNNRRDAVFYDYHSPAVGSNPAPDNISHFIECTFVTDNLLNCSAFTPLYHAQLWNTDGISFTGCHFANTNTGVFASTSQYGIGINAQQAKFSVDALCNILCTNPQPSTFDNLNYGVYATNFGSIQHSARIERSHFTNNLGGIFLLNVDYATITRNNFEVYRSKAPNNTQKTYGLYMTSCTGYHVEANYATEYNDPFVSGVGNSYGIVVDNSGTTTNLIYRNTFKDLNEGVQAQRVNATTSGVFPDPANNVGLQIKCNTFLKNIATADIAISSGEIDYHQGYHGSSLSLAGNTFSHSGNNSENDYFDAGMPIAYVYATGSVPHEPTAHTTTAGHEVNLDDDIYYTSNTCPSQIKGGFPISVPSTPAVLQSFLLHKTDSLRNVISQDEAKIDGGSTNSLLITISSESPGNVKNTLIQASPYLSDTVLDAYVATNPSAGLVKQVIIANSPITPPVYQNVLNMHLPHGIQKQIDAAQTGISARKLLENEIAWLYSQRSDLVNERIRAFLFDTISPNPLDSIIVLLKEENISIKSKRDLFDAYLSKADTVQAIAQRGEVMSQPNVCQHFASLSSIKLNLLAATSVVDAVNSDTQMQSDLTSIANSGDVCCSSKAQCLLAMAQDTLYAAYIEDLAPSNTAIGIYNGSNSMDDDRAQSNLSIYPNPSDGGQHISVALVSQDETLQNSRIEVYNLTGQLVQQGTFEGNNNIVSFSSDQLHQGVYFVKFINNGTVVEVKKLLVNN